MGAAAALGEVAALECPQPKVGELLVVQLAVADMAIPWDHNDMGALDAMRPILIAHPGLTLVFDRLAMNPVASIVLANEE